MDAEVWYSIKIGQTSSSQISRHSNSNNSNYSRPQWEWMIILTSFKHRRTARREKKKVRSVGFHYSLQSWGNVRTTNDAAHILSCKITVSQYKVQQKAFRPSSVYFPLSLNILQQSEARTFCYWDKLSYTSSHLQIHQLIHCNQCNWLHQC